MLGCLLTAVSCSDSEYELGKLVPEKYQKVVYFRDVTGQKQQVALSTVDSAYQDSMAVIKAGSDPSLKTHVTFEVMSQADLDEKYSNVEGIRYKLLPTDAYQFADEGKMTIEGGVSGKFFRYTVFPSKIYHAIKADPTAKLVLPIQIKSRYDTINADKGTLFLVYDVNSPMVKFANDDDEKATMLYKSLDIPIRCTLANYGSNLWDFTCSFQAADNAAELISEYNSYHATNYELMPAGAYTLGSSKFVKGKSDASAVVSVKRQALQNDHEYLLPLKMVATSNSQTIDVDTLVKYVVVSNPYYGIITPDRSAWKIVFCNSDNKMWGSGNDADGATAIIDGNLNTYWHSNWEGTAPGSYSGQDLTGKNKGHAVGDDYCYYLTAYHAFACKRDNPTIVVDLGEARTLIGVGIATRQHTSFRDMKDADILVSNDSEFKFSPIEAGGQKADYDAVALNNWVRLLRWENIPEVDGVSWYDAPDWKTTKGVKGRFVKIHQTASRRDAYLGSMAEFYVRQLVSINGEPVQ